MIFNMTVEQTYAQPGFEEMIAEYAEHAIKKMPKPLYRKEDYLPLEAAGVLTVWVALQDGIAVGFLACLASKIPHYGCSVMIAESLFVSKRARRRGTGLHFLNLVEAHAKSLGAPAVFVSCPIGSEFKKVLRRKNYSAETETYVKVLPLCN